MNDTNLDCLIVTYLIRTTLSSDANYDLFMELYTISFDLIVHLQSYDTVDVIQASRLCQLTGYLASNAGVTFL